MDILINKDRRKIYLILPKGIMGNFVIFQIHIKIFKSIQKLNRGLLIDLSKIKQKFLIDLSKIKYLISYIISKSFIISEKYHRVRNYFFFLCKNNEEAFSKWHRSWISHTLSDILLPNFMIQFIFKEQKMFNFISKNYLYIINPQQVNFIRKSKSLIKCF